MMQKKCYFVLWLTGILLGSQYLLVLLGLGSMIVNAVWQGVLTHPLSDA